MSFSGAINTSRSERERTLQEEEEEEEGDWLWRISLRPTLRASSRLRYFSKTHVKAVYQWTGLFLFLSPLKLVTVPSKPEADQSLHPNW